MTLSCDKMKELTKPLSDPRRVERMTLRNVS